MLIYLIDDHQMFAEAMKIVVAELIQDCVIDIFTSAESALKSITTATPDLILLDLEMADLSGLMLLEILSQNGKNIPVLVCSGNLTETNKQRVILSGAHGFLSKAQGTNDIHDAINSILANKPYPADIDKYKTPEQALLSNRQRAILSLMESGMPNAAIAETLFLSTNTIKTHIRLMYSALDVNSRIECLNKARELGLLNVI
ncbi:MAG TPA: hypothetical protein DIC30_10075 [Oceanospirillales bacterium]|jgi:DNA-binding NarL/FixJ family response regulator|nr:hypothetical protein [Oceanospirillales bacterium]|tara:strand:- start:2876 stop:3481 length:606 start_codon:yes stop_codon:yes gene_type:complete